MEVIPEGFGLERIAGKKTQSNGWKGGRKPGVTFDTGRSDKGTD